MTEYTRDLLVAECIDHGLGFMEDEDYISAIKEFEAAIRLNPESSKAHLNLGIALCESDSEEAGIAEIKKAIELDPTNEEAHDELAVVMGGEPETQKIKDEEEEEAIRKHQKRLARRLKREAAEEQ